MNVEVRRLRFASLSAYDKRAYVDDANGNFPHWLERSVIVIISGRLTKLNRGPEEDASFSYAMLFEHSMPLW